MNIFKMSIEEFNNYINSEEGEKFIEEGAKYILEIINNNPAYYSSNCENTNCKYNSSYSKDFVELGTITYCTKFPKGVKNTCKFII